MGQRRALQAFFQNPAKRFLFIQAGRNWGKMLTLTSLIPTPDRGFVPLSEIKENDSIFGSDGKSYQVIGLSPIDPNPIMYKVHFSDGTVIEACKDHQWLTYTKSVRKSLKRAKKPLQPKVVNTEEIKNSILSGRELNHAIPCSGPLDLPEVQQLLDPYLLGVWLGDGSSGDGRISTIDPEILRSFEDQGFELGSKHKCTTTILKLKVQLRELRVLNDKHIPSNYLWASREQRLALLQGLMDTDGTIGTNGQCCFDNANKDLADAVHFLAVSLGTITRRSSRIPKFKGKEGKLSHRVYFYPNGFIPFRLPRKAKRVRDKRKSNFRFIKAVEPMESKPGRCITVNSPDRLYLAGESLIPTHNTNFAEYLAWRFAGLFDKQTIYFIGAEKKQMKEIIWESRQGLSLKDFGPASFGGIPNETELRLEFPNGSQIKIDGSDNSQAYRGVPFDLMIFDEWKDHRYEFYEAVYPSLFKNKNSKICIIGTPPDEEDHHYVKHVENIKNDPDWVYIHGTAWDNPHIDHVELTKEKAKYYARGDGPLWEREYEAKFVFGGSSSIFPMWNTDIHQYQTQEQLLSLLERDRAKLKWFTIADPGSTTCFGVLFGCYNPYTADVYLLDEIYEKDQSKNSTVQIFGRIKAIEKRLYPNHPPKTFRRVYDEAAAWFANEVRYNFKEFLIPTLKEQIDKDSQISTIKDMLLHEKLHVATDCVEFGKEVRGYKTDDKGRTIKANDHLIDCLRYALAYYNYRFIEAIHKKERVEKLNTIASAMRADAKAYDWTSFADDPNFH